MAGSSKTVDKRGPQEQSVDAAPTELGRFLILRRAGAGGMGVVYVAYDPELDRKVAVKLLLPSLSGSAREEAAALRLVREAKAMARLSHPNVVSVYDVGTYKGQVFIAMEFIEGDALRIWLHETTRTTSEILAVFQEAGKGLAAAHREGLVHGDFKPDNVLVDRKGRVRVVDFGLASAHDRDDGEPTHSPHDLELSTQTTLISRIKGTPAYLAPEQLERVRGSPRTDQFSFCVSLYEGLYGQRPFDGTTVAELHQAIQSGVAPEPQARQLPTWLRRILVKGLSCDPAERFQDMDTLLAALARDPSRRRRQLLVGALALALLIVAGLSYRWALLRALHERQGLCAGAADELKGVWDEQRRQQAKRSFLATGLPYAADTWARVVVRLDRHTQAWIEMHTQACQATHLRGEQSPALLDLRMTCLQHRLTETRSLIDLLVNADQGVVENAAQAVAGLADLSPCADAAALLSAGSSPVTEEESTLIQDIRSKLAQARAQELLARFPPAQRLADLALAEAETLADRELIAEARLLQADLLARLGDPHADGAYEDAFFIAESTHADVLPAQISLALMHQATGRLDLAAANRWSRHARALIDRLGDERPVDRRSLESELYAQLGTLHVHENRLAQAEDDYRRSLDLCMSLPVEKDLRLAAIHNNLGNLQVLRGDFSRAAIQLERSAAIYREVLGQHHPSVAISLNNLGELASRRGEWEAARSTYSQALAILTAAVGSDHPNVGVIENNLGNVALELGEFDTATIRFTRAKVIFTASFGAENPALAFPLTGLGETLLAQGHPVKAQELLERALALRDQGSPAELARTRFSLAKALFATSDPDSQQRAVTLATQAHDGYSATGPAFARELAKTATWLSAHPQSALQTADNAP